MKICTKCNNKKKLCEFSKDKSHIDGFRSHCKKCMNIAHSYRYRTDLEYRINCIKRSSIYYKNNLQEVKQKHNKYMVDYNKQRLKIDLKFKIMQRLRIRIWDAIKNSQKAGSAVRDLGCTIDEFKIYIESKFQEGMTWENWGFKGWHLDHIIPLASFDLTNRKQFLKACHYANYQPLWAADNIRKGDKI